MIVDPEQADLRPFTASIRALHWALFLFKLNPLHAKLSESIGYFINAENEALDNLGRAIRTLAHYSPGIQESHFSPRALLVCENDLTLADIELDLNATANVNYQADGPRAPIFFIQLCAEGRPGLSRLFRYILLGVLAEAFFLRDTQLMKPNLPEAAEQLRVLGASLSAITNESVDAPELLSQAIPHLSKYTHEAVRSELKMLV